MRISRCRLSAKEPAKEDEVTGQSWNEKGYQGGYGGKDGGKNPWQKGSNQSMLDVWQDRPHCSVVSTRW